MPKITRNPGSRTFGDPEYAHVCFTEAIKGEGGAGLFFIDHSINLSLYTFEILKLIEPLSIVLVVSD